MDPVSLALGIAPLCVGALKGAKHAKSKIKLLKHHHREVSRFRKKFRTQVSIFQDESQLLLQNAGVDPDLAAVMVDDYNHEDWSGDDLDAQIRHFLGKRYSEVKQVAEQIHDQIAKFDHDLSKLEADPDEVSRNSEVSLALKGWTASKLPWDFNANYLPEFHLSFSPARSCATKNPPRSRGCVQKVKP